MYRKGVSIIKNKNTNISTNKKAASADDENDVLPVLVSSQNDTNTKI
jgi:hypothetical protein